MHLGWHHEPWVWGWIREAGRGVAALRLHDVANCMSRPNWDSNLPLWWSAEDHSSHLPAFVFHQHAKKQLCRLCKAKCILLKEITVIYPHVLTEADGAVEVELSCQVALSEPVCKERKVPSESEGKIALEMGKMVHLSKRQALWVCRDNDQFSPSPFGWYHHDSGVFCLWLWWQWVGWMFFDWNLDEDH